MVLVNCIRATTHIFIACLKTETTIGLPKPKTINMIRIPELQPGRRVPRRAETTAPCYFGVLQCKDEMNASETTNDTATTEFRIDTQELEQQLVENQSRTFERVMQ